MSDLFSWWPVQQALTDPKYHSLWRDLVGAWLPIGRGNVIPDVSGQGNPMAITNASIPASWMGGVDGWMLDLDGTDAELVASRVSGLSNWSVWLSYIPDDVTSISRTLLDQGDIFIAQIDDDIVYGATDTLEITYSGTISTVLTVGSPVDIFVTRSGTTITCYVYDSNGALTTGSFTATGTANSSRSSLIIGAPSRTALAFVDLTATDLAAAGEKALLITAADDIQLPVGSAPLNPGVNYENLNLNQATFGIWIESLNFEPGDGVQHYLIANLGTSADTNRLFIYIQTDGVLYFAIYDKDTTLHLMSHSITDWTIDERHQIVGTIDFNANTMALYVDGALEDDTGHNLSDDSVDVIEATTHLGADSSAGNQLNGSLTLQIWDVVKDATFVTAWWNSGNGVAFVVDPDTILLLDTKNETTNIIYNHSGKSGTTDNASFTTTEGVFGADNDAIRISDGTGYSVQGFIDGTPSGTNEPHDDGAGSPITDVEKVGVSIDCDGQYSAAGGNILTVGVNDFSISANIQFSGTPVGYTYIVSKGWPDAGWYGIGPGTGSQKISIILRDADDGTFASYAFNGRDLGDGRSHHIAVTFDRDANATLYVDGYVDGTPQDISAHAASLDDAQNLFIGSSYAGGEFFPGKISDVKFLTNGLWSAAQILYQATHPHDVGASAGTITEYYDFDENTGTTITAGVTAPGNNLILSDAAAWDQQASISLNLMPGHGFENGGIGGHTAGDAATTISKSTTEIFKDSLSLKVLNGDGTQAFDRFTITTATGQDYRFHARFFAPDTPNGASRLVDVDGVAALGITVTQAGLSAGWNEIEFCFEAQDTSTTIDLGSGSVTNTEFGYWDDVKVIVNMINKPGMEGGANPPAGWAQEANATVTSDTSPHSGTNCLKNVAGAANVGASQNVTLVDATNYTFAVWAKATSGDTAALVVDTGDGTIITLATTTSTSWTLLQGTFLSTGVSGVIYLRGVVNGDIVWFDDASGLKPDTAAASAAARARDFADGRVLPAVLWKRKLTALEVAELSRIRQGMFAYRDDTPTPDF